jgi:peptide/nickel transport system ATP-binding protein
VNEPDILIETRHLTKQYVQRGSLLDSFWSGKQEFVTAVRDVNLQIRRGELLVLAGQSGCGKSTLGMLLTLLERATGGSILFDGQDNTNLRGRALKAFRRRAQIVFQDPYESLNPRFHIEDAIREPLDVHGIGKSRRERRDLVAETLERVELRPASKYLRKYPHELSGGERQRVAIGRAVVLNPTFLVADEPVSMLDVSVRAGILNLILKLKAELNMTCLFITHDLSIARYISERLAIMFFGRLVEIGPTAEVLQNPIHPYTKLLMRSILVPDPTILREVAGFDPLAVTSSGETQADALANELARLRSSLNGNSELVPVAPDHFVALPPDSQGTPN